MSSRSYHTNILCKYLVILGLVAFFFIVIFFNQTYTNSQYFDSNIFTIKCQERLLQPMEAATNLSHLMFVLVGTSRAWKHRRTYIESWWRPNVTRGNLFLDVKPSPEFRPWSPTFPPYKVNEDLKKLRIYRKLRNPKHIRIYRSVLETHRLKQDEGVRWYVMGDDDSLFFVDNIVDVLSKYNHTEKHYIGMFSETIKSNFYLSFDMGFGGGGCALSYPLVEAMAVKLDECVERYHYIWAVDQLQSFCLADLGVDVIHEKGFHQMDLHGDLSGLLSAHPTAPLLSLHHFGIVAPLFPGMDRHASVLHLMKAANVDQSRMLQQSICHVRARNWTFSVSWGYSAHVYEKIFPRSHLKRPIETFRPWIRGRPPFYMFNTRPVSRDPCEAPHWFFFDSIEQESEGIVTSYTRTFPRNMTSCSFSGNISADPLASIRVFAPKPPKQWNVATWNMRVQMSQT
ncbi:uncharacterized protein LOC18018764 isoform X2 [Eutrema salsugineum]|uniref:uncharacterized protein LOC18018764 isoform X2 n=1 Tax=Eutrema salsugineum TaxID=72664 RepID=UPI000CED31F4|nr:uncharacterized protein LOC18018764 isoform X2 [Eutrema salsugineum]